MAAPESSKLQNSEYCYLNISNITTSFTAYGAIKSVEMNYYKTLEYFTIRQETLIFNISVLLKVEESINFEVTINFAVSSPLLVESAPLL